MTETWGLTHSVQCTPCSPAPAEPHHTPHNLTRPSFGNTSVMLMKSRPMRFGLGEVLWLKEHSPCNQKQFQNKSNPLLALLKRPVWTGNRASNASHILPFSFPIHGSWSLQLLPKAPPPSSSRFFLMHFCGPFLLLVFTQISIRKPKSLPSESRTDLRGLKEVDSFKPEYSESTWGGKGKRKPRNTQAPVIDIALHRSRWWGEAGEALKSHCWQSWGAWCWRGQGGRKGVWALPACKQRASLVTSWGSFLLETLHPLTFHIRKVYLAASHSLSKVSLSSNTAGCKPQVPLGSLAILLLWRC